MKTPQQMDRKFLNIKVENYPHSSSMASNVKQEEFKNYLIKSTEGGQYVLENMDYSNNLEDEADENDEVEEVIIEEFQDESDNIKNEEAESEVIMLDRKSDESIENYEESSQDVILLDTKNQQTNKKSNTEQTQHISISSQNQTPKQENPQPTASTTLNSNQYFLLSLTEAFDRLPSDRNMQARIKIMELLYKIENGLE